MYVLVNRVGVQNKRGIYTLQKTRPVAQEIVEVYDNGKVRTKSGDVWRVKRSSGTIKQMMEVKRVIRDDKGQVIRRVYRAVPQNVDYDFVVDEDTRKGEK